MENKPHHNIPVQQPKVYPDPTQTSHNTRRAPQSQTQYSTRYSTQDPTQDFTQYPQDKPKASAGKVIALAVLLAALVLGLVLLIPMLSGQETTVLSGGKKTKVTALSSNAEYGTVNGGGSYRKGEDVTLVAIPKDGCVFAGWSDGYSEPERTVKAGEEANYTAIFHGPLSDWTSDVPSDAVILEENTFYQIPEGEQFSTTDAAIPRGFTLVTTNKTLSYSEDVYVPDYWPSGFSTSHPLYDELSQNVPTGTDAREVTKASGTTQEYIYYHWCRGDRVAPKPPTNRKVATSAGGEFDTFHAYYSTRDPMASGSMTTGTYHAGSEVPNPSEYGAYHQPNPDCCCDSFWFFDLPVTRYTVDYFEVEYVYESTGEPTDQCPDGLPYTEVTQYRYRPQ